MIDSDKTGIEGESRKEKKKEGEGGSNRDRRSRQRLKACYLRRVISENKER